MWIQNWMPRGEMLAMLIRFFEGDGDGKSTGGVIVGGNAAIARLDAGLYDG